MPAEPSTRHPRFAWAVESQACRRTFVNRDAGSAWFAGPTFTWQATDKLSVTGAYNYQFAGRTETQYLPAGTRSKDFDLLNVNRHLAKLKVAYSF